MCGILLIITELKTGLNAKLFHSSNSKIHHYIKRRGPDSFHHIDFCYKNFAFHLESSVLNLRGSNLDSTKWLQPFQSSKNCLLQWNGEIFRIGLDLDENFQEMFEKSSDTAFLAELLSSIIDLPSFVLKVLPLIHGPWSMTFWDTKHQQLYIGRDIIGRRSLCWNQNHRDKLLIITSVVNEFDLEPLIKEKIDVDLFKSLKFEEIPNKGIFRFDFDWIGPDAENKIYNLNDVWGNVKQFYWPINIAGLPPFDDSEISQNSIKKLPKSPIQNRFNSEIPSDDIDQMLKDVKNLDENDGFKIPEEVQQGFFQVLSESVRIRCQLLNKNCKNCFKVACEQPNVDCEHSNLAVLFSGGVDSTVLAVLAHMFIEPKTKPIDLLNVAFDLNAPDRQTGLEAWQELCRLYPERQWNFVEINVNRDELNEHRQNRVRYLIQPLETVMDDSIGCSIWFAVRGEGRLRSSAAASAVQTSSKDRKNDEDTLYKTPARVVFLGMGADEQLGGYSRHRTIFESKKWQGLIKHLQTDIERIAHRNLGRDDRITSDHGVEARMPYLDEKLISYLNFLPVWYKCNPYLPRGFGEKWLLRLIAKKFLHLEKASTNLKRAIQFGSRITKFQLSNSCKGGDRIDYNEES